MSDSLAIKSNEINDSQENLQLSEPVLLASFWRRVAAHLVDFSIVKLPLIIALFAFMFYAFYNNDSSSFESITTSIMGILFLGIILWPITFIISIIFFLVDTLYKSVMESSSKKGTSGKVLFKIEVTDLNGNRLQFKKALKRNIMKSFLHYSIFTFSNLSLIMSSGPSLKGNIKFNLVLLVFSYISANVIPYLLYLAPLFTKQRQAIHDSFANTLVISNKTN